MSQSTIVFRGVFPIGDTRVQALPVKELGPAIDYYCQNLGFRLVSQGDVAVLRRDDAEIGLEANGDDPEQASCYFSVSDVDALREELAVKGMDISPTRLDEHGGKRYRVFFAREPYGVCFCFGQPT